MFRKLARRKVIAGAQTAGTASVPAPVDDWNARDHSRWATDLKPEKYLTQERADTLRKAGAVACALGVESGSPRVLELIDKGAPIEVVGDVIDRLSHAGIAAEAMCFTDFPTETHDEAQPRSRSSTTAAIASRFTS